MVWREEKPDTQRWASPVLGGWGTYEIRKLVTPFHCDRAHLAGVIHLADVDLSTLRNCFKHHHGLEGPVSILDQACGDHSSLFMAVLEPPDFNVAWVETVRPWAAGAFPPAPGGRKLAVVQLRPLQWPRWFPLRHVVGAGWPALGRDLAREKDAALRTLRILPATWSWHLQVSIVFALLCFYHDSCFRFL